MDIALKYNAGIKQFDLAIEDGDLATETGLETAVIISLFTDRRALANDNLPDGTNDRRGYWVDVYNDRPLGSRLWLLFREKEQDEVLRRAKIYAEEALVWLLEDEIAETLEVEVWHVRRDTLGLRVTIRQGNRQLLERQYDYVWRDAA